MTINGEPGGCGTSTSTIPVDEKLAEKLCSELGKEDLVWNTGFGFPKYIFYDEEGHVISMLDNLEVLKGEL